MNSIDCWYFGCWDQVGHYLHSPGRRHVSVADLPRDFPVCTGVLDGGLLPPRLPEVEGRATLAHIDFWTVLAFWDRSVDKRSSSCSAFVMRGHRTFDEACKISKEHFPYVWSRFKFPVVLSEAVA